MEILDGVEAKFIDPISCPVCEDEGVIFSDNKRCPYHCDCCGSEFELVKDEIKEVSML